MAQCKEYVLCLTVSHLAGIPDWIGWLRYISFIYYGFGMLLHIEYQGRTIYSCIDSSLTQNNFAMSVQVCSHCHSITESYRSDLPRAT